MLLLLLAGPAIFAAAPAGAPLNGMGVVLPADWLTTPLPAGEVPSLPWAGSPAGVPLYVRVTITQEALDQPEVSALRLRTLLDHDLVPVLLLESPGADTPANTVLGFDLDEWLTRVDRLLQAMGHEPVLVQVMDRPLRQMTAALYAFVLKRTAVLVRAVAPGSRIATGTLEGVGEARELAAWRVGPYLDAVVMDRAAAGVADLAGVRLALPATQIWLSGAGGGGGSYLREAGLAFSRAIPLVFAAPDSDLTTESLAAWQRILGPGTVVVPPAFRRVEVRAGAQALPPENFLELEQPDGRRFVVAFQAPADLPLEMTIRGPRVSVAWILDPATGEETMGGAADWLLAGGDPGSQAVSRVTIHVPELPLVVRLGRVGGAAPRLAEREEVVASRSLTVEEILVRHREVQAGQDLRLHTTEADVRIDFHFSVTNLGQTFDVATLNRFFHDATRTVYEERAVYLNGALWRGKRPPDLPFVLPGRVTEVPLDLSLDLRYIYTLEKTEQLNGRQVYVVSFAPDAGSEAPYRGRVWIDTQSFVKRRQEVVELNPKLPVISNHLEQQFAPVTLGGRTWWLVERMTGEMIFTALGRNVVLERDLTYSDYQINLPAFGERLDESFASDRPLLEDTGDGFQRLGLVRDGQGGYTRRASELSRTGVSRLLVGTWSMGDDLGLSVPFAGVNYFNFDWRGSGTQVDVVWAGPFLDLLWSDPSFGGGKAILALQGRVNPLFSRNRRIDAGDAIDDEIKAERLEDSSQLFQVILGRPLGGHHKFEFQLDMEHLRFRREDKTAADFVVPSDTWQELLTGRWVYARSGWGLEGAIQGGSRNDWSFWGSPDGSDFSDGDEQFARSSVELSKAFYSANRNKFGFGVAMYHGNGLDRFSKFELGNFGVVRVPGYSGDAIRFRTGGALNLGGAFALGKKMRMDVGLTHARFRDEEDLGPHVEHATGGSVALNFSGPFNAFMRLRLGFALESSVDDADGGGSLRVTYFRTFRRWFWQRSGEKKQKNGPGS